MQSNQISSLVNLFRDDSILPFLIPVIYNVCVDYGMSTCQGLWERGYADIW